MISSIRPHSSSRTTTSPTRMAPENAIWMPANTDPSEVCAARPATTDSTPAEASSVLPMSLNDGNVIRAAAPPSTMMTATASRRRVVTWVMILRRCRSASPSPESPPAANRVSIWRSTTLTKLATSQVTDAISARSSRWSTHPRQPASAEAVRWTAAVAAMIISVALAGRRVRSATSCRTWLRRPSRCSNHDSATPRK